jgi:hypothetical protein
MCWQAAPGGSFGRCASPTRMRAARVLTPSIVGHRSLHSPCEGAYSAVRLEPEVQRQCPVPALLALNHERSFRTRFVRDRFCRPREASLAPLSVLWCSLSPRGEHAVSFSAGFELAPLILRPNQQRRQPGDICRDPPGFVSSHKIARRSASRLLLEIVPAPPRNKRTPARCRFRPSRRSRHRFRRLSMAKESGGLASA